MKKKTSKKISAKVAKIMKEGVRSNTKKPVSKSNPRRPVGQKQAVAIAYSMSGKSKKKSKGKKFNGGAFAQAKKKHFNL